jgi:predicted protein tyrosine phosphatase
MTTDSRPILESYWVVPGRFLAGEYPLHDGTFEENHQRLDAFLRAGFDTFIDLTAEGENAPYQRMLTEQAKQLGLSAECKRFPIGDFGLPTPEGMKAALDAIEEALSDGRRVYLHCWGGIGRTGTTVGCYLVRRGLTGEQALEQLAAWWKTVPKSRYHANSPETLAQTMFVRNWQE